MFSLNITKVSPGKMNQNPRAVNHQCMCPGSNQKASQKDCFQDSMDTSNEYRPLPKTPEDDSPVRSSASFHETSSQVFQKGGDMDGPNNSSFGSVSNLSLSEEYSKRYSMYKGEIQKLKGDISSARRLQQSEYFSGSSGLQGKTKQGFHGQSQKAERGSSSRPSSGCYQNNEKEQENFLAGLNEKLARCAGKAYENSNNLLGFKNEEANRRSGQKMGPVCHQCPESGSRGSICNHCGKHQGYKENQSQFQMGFSPNEAMKDSEAGGFPGQMGLEMTKSELSALGNFEEALNLLCNYKIELAKAKNELRFSNEQNRLQAKAIDQMKAELSLKDNEMLAMNAAYSEMSSRLMNSQKALEEFQNRGSISRESERIISTLSNPF